MNEEFANGMRAAGKLAARTLQWGLAHIDSGVTTNFIDQVVHDFIIENGGIPAPLNYKGFPKSCCISINDEACHGVPSERIIRDGDMVNLDVTVILNGYHGDTSATVDINTLKPKDLALIQIAKQAMMKGIEAITPNGHTGDIGFAINKFVQNNGMFTVREIGGHGIGKEFHMSPFVSTHGKKGHGELLKPWTCITVEPIVNLTETPVLALDIPGSLIQVFKNLDGSPSAQFEHTVLITDTGYEILTLL